MKSIVLDVSVVTDFYAMKAEWTFEDLMVHLLEPRNDLLPEERGGREAKDRDVHTDLATNTETDQKPSL